METMKSKKQIVAKKDLAEAVKEMMSDKEFLKILPDMLSASKAATKVGVMHSNKKMIEFNTLCANFMEAVLKKDEKAAISAAEKLVSAGHGEAFGLEGTAVATANLLERNKLINVLISAGISVTGGVVKLNDILDFVTADSNETNWSKSKLDAASEAIAKKCMSLHKEDSAWNPICADELAKTLEQSLGFVNAVKLTQIIEAAWKDKKRDLESLSAAISDGLLPMKIKSST